MQIFLEVTQSDIDRGVPGHANYCPVANSLKRHFPDCAVTVGRNWIYIFNKDVTKTLYFTKLTPEVEKYVLTYDHLGGNHIEPKTFDIELKEFVSLFTI